MNKSMKPTAPKPMTEEEKKNQIARFIQQKRETFAQGALFSLLQNPSLDIKSVTPAEIAKYAREVGEAFLEEIYPIAEPKEAQAE